MACVQNMPPKNDDSEMEEGEIVDDLDELSDISSEEEFLLRQRLQVLESYNNVLERKKAKHSSVGSGKQRDVTLLHDLSEISGTDFDDTFPNIKSKTNIIVCRNVNNTRHIKSHHKQKKRKDLEAQRDIGRNKEYKKKTHRKKKLELKVISESSDDSDDEYRNKRRKLANAVIVHRDNNDRSSLQDRLQKMLCGTTTRLDKTVLTDILCVRKTEEENTILTVDKETETDIRPTLEDVSCSPIIVPDSTAVSQINNEIGVIEEVIKDTKNIEIVDLCTDDDVTGENVSKDKTDEKMVEKTDEKIDKKIDEKVDENKKDDENNVEKDSDEDLELLRQHALKTKASKLTNILKEPENKPLTLSEDEDSDTTELRLICLKSALLKKAIEMKQKQKLKKRLSQSSNLQDDLFREQEELLNKIDSNDNNTDIESVDMDIGSDVDEKGKELLNECFETNGINRNDNAENKKNQSNVPNLITSKEDELDEDEDLLRARLLTSLSKNLPHLVDPNILNSIEELKTSQNNVSATNGKVNIPEEKRIVINVGGSDSEGEHEATKNLTKMHMKLSEQLDFQQKLDMFLKSTRMEVEKTKEPDVQNTVLTKPTQKFVAKVVNHLPKSEQMEYKNLVKRMAELEKIKQARQSSMSFMNRPGQGKETLKPRNVSIDSANVETVNNLEEQIALSRKNIAEESAKMLKLRDEATKLSQKYKIVSTELRNITTAINLNRKEQRSVQNRLSKIRGQHQRLLNSATSIHSKTNGHLPINRAVHKIMSTTKLQKENDPTKQENKTPYMHKSLKVSVVNDIKDETTVATPRLSVQIDVCNNRKTVKMPVNDRIVDIQNIPTNADSSYNLRESHLSLPAIENGEGNRINHVSTNVCNQKVIKNIEFNDYESPLQALGTATWEGDPNAILCPFEVCGNCKDTDCKYLHPTFPTIH